MCLLQGHRWKGKLKRVLVSLVSFDPCCGALLVVAFEISAFQTSSKSPAWCELSDSLPLRVFMPCTPLLFMMTLGSMTEKQSNIYCKPWRREGFGWSCCVFSAKFLRRSGSGNPPKMWSQTGCSDREPLGTTCFKLWILNMGHFAATVVTSWLRYSRVCAVLLQGSCEFRSRKNRGLRFVPRLTWPWEHPPAA